MMPDGPRAELAALCDRGLDWRTDLTHVLPDTSRSRHAAVLVLFGVLDSEPARAAGIGPVSRDLDVLLLRRAATLGSHPGQIAFPGGRLEASDSGPIAAAMREAVEETGLDPAGLEPLGTLPDFPLAASNHLVTPVPAWWTYPSHVAAVDHRETVDVFRVPVADLLNPVNRVATAHQVDDRVFHAPAFQVDGRLIWGFTAIVLSRMFEELDWAVSWDQEQTVRPTV